MKMEELSILSNVKKRVLVDKSHAEMLRAYKYYKTIDIYEGKLIIFSNEEGIGGPNGLAGITEDVIVNFCSQNNRNLERVYTAVPEINIDQIK